MSRVYAPLTADHPAITDGKRCGICGELFREGQRTMLLAAQVSDMGPSTVQAALVHATCALKGANLWRGEIKEILDGDTEFPVLMTDGDIYRLEDVGLE